VPLSDVAVMLILLLIIVLVIVLLYFVQSGSTPPSLFNHFADEYPENSTGRQLATPSINRKKKASLLPMSLPHASRAIQIANAQPSLLSSVLLIDIGTIASWSSSADSYRTTPIPSDARTLQPYAQLMLSHSGLWQFTFEIYDFEGTVLFKREISTYLEAGQHLIMPPARLRLSKTPRVGVWTISLRVNSDLLARHRFTWHVDEQSSVMFALDGEVDESYLELLEESPVRPLSIDELLTAPPHVKPRTLPP
jgi:hypothetical protein